MTAVDMANAARESIADFTGRLIGPSDADYDDARRVYNAMIDRRPALVARVQTEADISSAVRFARDRELRLAVRGGGHNGAGSGTVDDGVVIDLGALRDVTVDPQARTVRVGGGATWGEVDRATNAHGMATPSGIISTTGVGGLTLGGGLGHLTRKCGLAIDNVLEAEMVLASGEQVQVSAEKHSDLYWAIRGGGGNFGIVTSFLFRLHDVDTVVAGPTFWPVEQSTEVLSVYREFLPNAPRELNGFFAFHTLPPSPAFPADLHLHDICGVVWCYVGSDTDAAGQAMAPFLDALPEPLLHGPAPVPHPAIQGAFDELYPRGHQWFWRADFVTDIPDPAVALHAHYGQQMPRPTSTLQTPTLKSTMHLYPVDGAAHDVGTSDTAWSYREANWGTVYAGVDPDPANSDEIRTWTVDYFEALHPYSAGGAYVNMMMDEGPERVRASYRDNYDRLAQIKAEYDPDNVFNVNQNIAPAK
jgi:FAD/FMN-containing dehydrogenase